MTYTSFRSNQVIIVIAVIIDKFRDKNGIFFFQTKALLSSLLLKA